MKQVLITGKKSYLGNQLEIYFQKKFPNIQSTKVSLRSNEWQSQDWSKYDAIIHVAGIAHNSSKKNMKEMYYSINRDLTCKVAKKAKKESLGLFINLSSMIVYGSKAEAIHKDTTPNPDNFYGDSKLQADESLIKMRDNNFKVAIIRPPMIYGKKSKGNYPILAKMAKKTPIFPDFKNKRSMLYVENLCELISLIIINESDGLYLPQNKDFVQTSEMVKEISIIYNNKIWFIKLFNPIIKLFKKITIINKIFGDLYYDKDASKITFGEYQIYDLKASINKTETN